MREIVHIQAGQCGNQIGAKVNYIFNAFLGEENSQHLFSGLFSNHALHETSVVHASMYCRVAMQW